MVWARAEEGWGGGGWRWSCKQGKHRKSSDSWVKEGRCDGEHPLSYSLIKSPGEKVDFTPPLSHSVKVSVGRPMWPGSGNVPPAFGLLSQQISHRRHLTVTSARRGLSLHYGKRLSHKRPTQLSSTLRQWVAALPVAQLEAFLSASMKGDFFKLLYFCRQTDRRRSARTHEIKPSKQRSERRLGLCHTPWGSDLWPQT